MPPAVSASLLFHPKRSVKRSTPLPERKTPSGTPPGSQTPSQPSPKPTTTTNTNEGVDDDASLQLPDVPYQEFRLMSSALNGWRYDVMKFDSRKPIDISTWQAPIKLNRKEPRRDDGMVTGAAPVAVGPMLGPDGKPVIGMDGRIVMVDAEGRPIHPSIPGGGDGGSWRDSRMKLATNGQGRKKFQKKTRQVFLVPDATRQLRREERYPWVMEDASQKEVWVGKLEEVSKSETQALFMPAANDVFKFVPAHRWYKFQKKPNYHIPSLEEAESIMARHQKNKDPERWLLHNRQGRGPSAATAAVFRAQSEGRSAPGSEGAQSLGPGGRKLKTVDSGMDGLFEEDEDNQTKRKKQKEYGGEGDMDEMEYEEDFADDEEKVEEDNEDEEAKELEERLKREYKNANKQREGYVDESEEEDDGSLTRDGKAMKKLIRNLEKNAAYDSDDEKNPYASSDEEEEPVPNGKDTTQPPPPSAPTPAPTPATPSRSGSQPPKPQAGTAGRGQPTPTGGTTSGSTNVSRATSPAPTGGASNIPVVGMGGHSVVAKRATSPKPRTTGVAVTPAVPRSSPGSRASSPNATAPGSQKRKASEDGSGVGSAGTSNGPRPKKRKGTLGGLPGGAPVGELEDRMVIEWLRNTPNASTRDCIQHFTPYLTDEAKKSKFTALVKEVAQLKGGVLVLRNAYRAGS